MPVLGSRAFAWFAVASIACVAVACKKDKAGEPDAATPAEPRLEADATAGESRSTSSESAGALIAAAATKVPEKLRPRSPAEAGKTVDVPAGVLLSGTLPSDEGRDPGAPAGLSPFPLGAFTIDALPYPNDPSKPFATQLSRDDAQKACQDKGARLCTELEWERACKGPDADTYATGAAWDPVCDTDPSSCSSGFGVRAMGALREWVDGKAEPGQGLPVRGGGPKEPGAGVHRCARRGRAQGTSTDLGFRCCKGGERPKTADLEPFRKTKLDKAELAQMVADAPELAKLGADVRLFDPADANAVTGRTQAPREGLTFVTQPILWSPDPGVEVLVVTGRSKTASFVLALFPLPSGKYKTASYFVMLGDVAPVALAYNPSKRRELQWTTCWGCSGETGAVSFREDRRIVIVQL
ncbi:MAG: hypothetical protein JNM74_16405 [Myxococcales bacterium]|nr:hypothetical protein [Myxococcales bacterium]